MKYRAWDKVAKRYDDTIFIDCEGNLWKDCDPHGLDMSGTKTITMSASIVSKERVDIELFTGLKDTNGTEIYEGDLLSSFIEEVSGMITGKVKFNDGGYDCEWGETDGIELSHASISNCGMEVIGNIHQDKKV